MKSTTTYAKASHDQDSQKHPTVHTSLSAQSASNVPTRKTPTSSSNLTGVHGKESFKIRVKQPSGGHHATFATGKKVSQQKQRIVVDHAGNNHGKSMLVEYHANRSKDQMNYATNQPVRTTQSALGLQTPAGAGGQVRVLDRGHSPNAQGPQTDVQQKYLLTLKQGNPSNQAIDRHQYQDYSLSAGVSSKDLQ